MTLSCIMIVDGKDHVQYVTVSKSYSDDYSNSIEKLNLLTVSSGRYRPFER